MTDLAAYAGTACSHYLSEFDGNSEDIQSVYEAFRNIQMGLAVMQKRLRNNIQNSFCLIRPLRKLWAHEADAWLSSAIKQVRLAADKLENFQPDSK